MHPSERARAAFWAARGYVVEQKPQRVSEFLRIAAEDGSSFYGVLARAALGRDTGFDWDDPAPPDDALRAAAELPGVQRALALGQIGQSTLAEQEIRMQSGHFSLCGEGLCIGYDGGDAVSSEYKPRFEWTGGRIVKVVFDVADDRYVDVERQMAAALARD